MNQQMKRWQDMSPGKRTVILTIGVIQLLLLLAAQLDLTFRPAEQVRGKKSYWRLGALISFWGPGLLHFRHSRGSSSRGWPIWC